MFRYPCALHPQQFLKVPIFYFKFIYLIFSYNLPSPARVPVMPLAAIYPLSPTVPASTLLTGFSVCDLSSSATPNPLHYHNELGRCRVSHELWAFYTTNPGLVSFPTPLQTADGFSDGRPTQRVVKGPPHVTESPNN